MSVRGFKVVFVGESNSGKTSLILRVANDWADPDTEPTINSTCRQLNVPVDGQTIVVNIWDTAGQERFRAMTTNFFRDAHCVVVCYDTTDLSSYEGVPFWVEEQRRNAPGSVLMIVGCKTDLPPVVPEATAREYAASVSALFASTSATTGDSLDVFLDLQM